MVIIIYFNLIKMYMNTKQYFDFGFLFDCTVSLTKEVIGQQSSSVICVEVNDDKINIEDQSYGNQFLLFLKYFNFYKIY